MDPRRTPLDTRLDTRLDTLLDTLLGWLVLAPLAVLCAPAGFSLFDGAPDTVAIGTGIAALGVLPALILALVRGRGDRGLPLAPLWVPIISAAAMLPRAADTFGAWRSLTGLVAAVGFATAGASLGASGRRVLQRGLGLAALMLLLSAPMGAAWTGALGNTGDLSEAALPCAILGAGAFLTANGVLAFAGFAAILLYGLYAGFVPVYAGLAGLGAAAAVAAFGSIAGRQGGEIGRQGAAKRLRILLVALLLGLLPMAYRAYAADAPDTAAALVTPSQASAATDGTTGGIEFRRLTWARVPGMIADHLEFGAGPGQFQAAFPPYRDPAEITLSSYGRLEPTPNEVEHAHNDWLTALAEHGFVGGGALVLFLLIILWRSCRATWGDDSTQRDFGFAAVAILVNAAFNSPLLYGPAAPAIAFAIFGVVGAPAARSAAKEAESQGATDKLGRAIRYGVPGLALIALLLVAGRALSFIEYGRALAEIPGARVVLEDGREQLHGKKLAGILDRAAEAAPDSPIVLEKRAQLLSRQGAPLPVQRDVIERWLRVRPLSFSSNLATGVLHAKEGRFGAARASFEKARTVDPKNPLALQNLLRVACDLRSPERVEEALQDLGGAGLLTADYLRPLAIEEMLSGRLESAAPLVLRMTEESPRNATAQPGGQLAPSSLGGGSVDVLDANSSYSARRKAQTAGDDLLADAYNVAFQMVMALDHLKSGLPAQAAISAHQALQSARGRGLDIGPIRLRKAAAKAAAALADGSPDPKLLRQAKSILAEEPIRAQDRMALSEIEKRSLRSAGLLERPLQIETPPPR